MLRRLLLVALVITTSTSAQAHKRFARKLGVECKECHESPEGGGPRNLWGQYFQATGELPIDCSETTTKMVETTVDRWMLELLSKPPTLRWGYVPLEKLPEEAPRTYTPAPDNVLLRRLSLDLRGTTPTEKEFSQLLKGKKLDAFIDEWMASKDFSTTFFLYHKDIIRPRTGIFNSPVSFSRIAPVRGGAWSSERLRTEGQSGACASDKTVKVSPWWDRNQTLDVCSQTASMATTVTVAGKTLRCDSEDGQKSGLCGCGLNLVFCYKDGIRDDIIGSMKNEMANLAMAVVDENRPYSEVLTSDWTMLDGKLEVYYGKLWGDQASIKDPDASKPWRHYERDPRHSGVLSSPAMVNFFYNGRRWAERVLEAFFCHDTTPDFNLLDDTVDAGESVVVPYRDSPDLMPNATVTQGRACAACHMQLDAVARLKDRWDYFGGYHEVMNSERALPIPQTAIFLGKEIDGLNGLGQALADSPIFHDCVANQTWDHLMGHRFRPDELATRKGLVTDFENKNLNFKELLRAAIHTPEYRSMENVKLMKKEQYNRSMGRITDVAWKVAEKSGWELYYDKVGGMDYRKIEFRDLRPGVGHSLVQFKAAGETCNEFVDREAKRKKTERLWLNAVDSVSEKPSSQQLDDALARLTAKALTRAWTDVSDDEKKILRDLFSKVQRSETTTTAWKSVCTATFASADYALY